METERVHEGVFEGFRLAETGRVDPRGTKAVTLWLLGICEFESTGSLGKFRQAIDDAQADLFSHLHLNHLGR